MFPPPPPLGVGGSFPPPPPAALHSHFSLAPGIVPHMMAKSRLCMVGA
jgi:hypothetical protein